MKMKRLMLMMGAALLLAACGGKKSQTAVPAADSTQTATTDSAVADTSYCGTYRGTLPAADCDGIKTVLTLSSDSTYSLQSDYIGKKNGQFTTSGVYHIRHGKIVELVTPSSGELTYYKIKDAHSVILTDSLGNEPEGETAPLYVLKR
jgi:copper homeostasis protein (lipoprotein)